MVTLYGFGPFLGTPDSSPFVIKVMMLLKLAGLPYREELGNPFKAPHRFLPYFEDDGVKVADSTLIRFHIEHKYRIDFDADLSAEQKAITWAVERMCEDHLYFAMLDMRWIDTANFNKGLGRHMFGAIPAPVRPIVKSLLRRMNAKRLQGHGIGRHARPQIAALAIRDVNALAAILADKPFLMGDKPCAADAFIFGIVTSILTPPLESPIRAAMQGHANLVAYRDRITSRYFSEQPVAAVMQAESSGSRRVAHSR
ncbi:Glutathione S-transferase [Rhizobiales bacterium GAS191]|nr:Glutathione S-transferase [Rhizobiales bacterium GAS113]SEC81846.1 Glutathione S-transferase [Rhizobiales bacterium GAS191]